MNTTKTKYSPSVNIIRDKNYSFNYIPTSNAIKAFDTIISDSKSGVKSHVLIGSYGTGKSSFLLALQQTIEGSQIHFKHYQKTKNENIQFEFLNIVGEFSSFETYFAKLYNLDKNTSSSDVIKALDKHYKSLKKTGKGLAILVDEFGKFLEYASKNNPESELYFIQQLAEWINDADKNTQDTKNLTKE